MTLKELRTNARMTQFQVAELLGVIQPEISCYENGTMTPDLENIFILENYFKARIDWQEKYSPLEKRDIVQGLIDLFQNYPIPVVLEAGARWYRREQNPEKLIQHYAQITQNNQEPLYPPGIEIERKPCNCSDD